MGAFSLVGRECGCLFSGRAGMREPFQWSGGDAEAFLQGRAEMRGFSSDWREILTNSIFYLDLYVFY